MQLADYRELHVHQPFDKIASVGMFEHVGRAQMGRYFDTVARLLRPGGLVLNHGITAGGVDNAQLGAGMGDFIEQYIFPGGELLHVSTVLQDLARASLSRMGLGQFDVSDAPQPADGDKALDALHMRTCDLVRRAVLLLCALEKARACAAAAQRLRHPFGQLAGFGFLDLLTLFCL